MYNYNYKDGLQSERLITRNLVPDDYKIWTNFLAEKDNIQYLPFKKFTSAEEHAKFWIEKQLCRYVENRFGLQALIHKETKEFIGQCGLLLQDVNGKSEVEVGYHIFKKYQGKGYATEAAMMFRDYGFENNSVDSIVSIIDIGNLKSQKVAIKNGMERKEQTKWADLDIFIYRINREDWLKKSLRSDSKNITF